MKQCLVTLPLREGGQRYSHLHTLPHGTPSRTPASPPVSASSLKQASVLSAGLEDAGVLLPSSGTAWALCRKQRSPRPDSLRSTAPEMFDVPVQRDFRATLRGVGSPLLWTEVVQRRSFVACAAFVPE